MPFCVIDSPVGHLRVAHDEISLTEVQFSDDTLVPPATPLLQEAAEQLQAWFRGTRRDFSLPLHMIGTDFQLRCWQTLLAIPYGQTITYGQQARMIGSPKATRAVGGANHRNPLCIVVPCHRVIGADGTLTGFGGGLDTKRWLLAHEQRMLAACVSAP